MPQKSSWASSSFSMAACRETTKSPVLIAISQAQAFQTLTPRHSAWMTLSAAGRLPRS
jgi:hypothetical protein